MAVTVTRTFDILERYLQEFPRKDALGGKKDGAWYTFSTQEYNENRTSLPWELWHWD